MTEERPDVARDNAGVPAAAQEKPLEESLDDASVLLWFATREGKSVEKDVLASIVDSLSKLRKGDRDPAVEGRFWAAYRELAKAVQPASIDSILATYSYPFGYHRDETRKRRWYHRSGTGKGRWADATKTKKRYSFVAVVALGFLIIVQIYWFIGTTWRTDLEDNRAELDRIAGDLREMGVNIEVAKELAGLKNQQISAQQLDDAAMIGGDNDSLVIVEKQLLVLQEKRGRAALDAKNVILRGERIQKMLCGNSRMLDVWDFVTELVSEEAAATSATRTGEIHAGAICNEVQNYNTVNDNDHYVFVDDNNVLSEELIKTATSFEKQHLGVEHALVNSKSMLAILTQYLLPLLYGLLGAYAYILRRLSKEIHDVTFTRGSEIGYSLRWPLGMLGGVTVGLFFDPADFSGLAVITPLGLAFLAGYGVELLFTGLDRMVSAFTGEDSARAKAARTE